MATSKTISAALKLVDNKKDNLKKAYDDLQSHSSLFSSFPLSWSHIDSHFTSIHNSLSQRFLHLQSLESQFQLNHNDPSTSPSKKPKPEPKVSNLSSFPNDPSSFSNPTTQNGTVSVSVTHLEPLSKFCKESDGKGLRDYIGENFKDKVIIKDEIQKAFKCASDPAAMILDSMDGVFDANEMKDGKEPRLIKKCCEFLFQQLRVFSPYVSFDVKKKAKRLFSEWKVNLVNEITEPGWTMAFLHFVAAYDLLSELNVSELAAYSATAAARDELPELYQIIALSDRVPGHNPFIECYLILVI